MADDERELVEKTYRVSGPKPWEGHEPGSEFKAHIPAGREALLIASGQLEVDKADRIVCPACAESGMKRPHKFDTNDELREHYAEKHAGLVPPTEGEEA